MSGHPRLSTLCLTTPGSGLFLSFFPVRLTTCVTSTLAFVCTAPRSPMRFLLKEKFYVPRSISLPLPNTALLPMRRECMKERGTYTVSMDLLLTRWN
ncbi:uncharacterized protein BDZ99DRAFT_231773 [Mytilinidion resinicola]|uniref:Uncharacterized protein n=1 Tax=Mytilinidion resinicola TaxID=574789 RepID=A0A6A6Z1L5_9PEZI|nr:uncharacterized protein BDZ99DRAFT_231773 [Mytilinidion resinicola]KAF2814127.1 hypothetical protein BDZ99DRAFT_231773 [Mytilinidion resinicola]